jgi:hypothetical protein
MPTVNEGIGQTELNAGLDLGLETLSLQQVVTFTKYIRQVLPLDGYVFWVRWDLLSPAALKTAGTTRSGGTVKVKGSLHYATDDMQREDETLSLNRVIFTAEAPIDEFNQVASNVMYLATFGITGKGPGLTCDCPPGKKSGTSIRFSFTRRRNLYRQAGLYHYEGDAVYPALSTQIIDDLTQLPTDPIVSNSLPVWLSLNQYFPVYPSFLVDDNIVPPFASIHIGDTDTNFLQPIPYLDKRLSHHQLADDKVRITLYGLTNNVVLDYYDYLIAYMTNHDDVMGLMSNTPPRDAKRTQSEMNVIAMKKVMEFRVSYYQTRIRDLSRQLILSAIPQILINPL